MKKLLLTTLTLILVLFVLAQEEEVTIQEWDSPFDEEEEELLWLGMDENKPRKLNVAIIGSGIAGASNALYLRDLFGDRVNIQIFEREDTIGGRIGTYYVNKGKPDQLKVERGGANVVAVNAYAQEIIKRFNLTFVQPSDPTVYTAIIDTSNHSVAWEDPIPKSAAQQKLFERFGNHLLLAANLIGDQVSKLNTIYQRQANKEAFDDLETLIEALGFYDETQHTYYQRMIADNQLNPDLLRSILEPQIRVNYLQDAKMSAFAGSIGTAGFVHPFGSIAEGALEMVRKSIKASRARVYLKSAVKEIEKCGKKLYLRAKHCNCGRRCIIRRHCVDVIVVAAPLEFADIKFKKINLPPAAKYKRPYRKTYVTVLTGELNDSFLKKYGLNPEKNFTVYTTANNPKEDFISAAVLGRVKKNGKQTFVYKSYTKVPMTKTMLNKYYKNWNVEFSIWHWAYPILGPVCPAKWHPVKLSDDIYYINSFESIVSTMETQMMSSKNVALLIAKKYK